MINRPSGQGQTYGKNRGTEVFHVKKTEVRTKYSTETVTQLKQPGASHASYLRSQKSPQVYGALMVLYWQLMNHKTVNLWKSEGEQ